MNDNMQLKEDNLKKEKKEMISFSEVDKDGVFREAYGFIDNRGNDNQSFEDRIKEMREKIKKR